jgi:crotonobetainyl-CoA:carnitine CoA-transferase CaiB-like acyl-CoA transferase
VEWLDSEGMAEDLMDGKWLDESDRQSNVDHIIEVLEKWTQKHTVNELVEQGQLMHFPWAAVSSIAQVVGNPQLNERGFFVEVLDPQSGKPHKYPGVRQDRPVSWQIPRLSSAGITVRRIRRTGFD